MNTLRIAAVFLMTVTGFVACDKPKPSAPVIDYAKLCEHLIPLYAPESGRAEFSRTCEETYKRDIPICRSAVKLAECLAGIKTWDERIACANLCKVEAPLTAPQ